jgi:hypothetical protein
MGWNYVDWIQLAQDTDGWRAYVKTAINRFCMLHVRDVEYQELTNFILRIKEQKHA